jgi:flavin reductase (DIM6/NTAB) family NADH-FMN oxidoreductase RutF
MDKVICIENTFNERGIVMSYNINKFVVGKIYEYMEHEHGFIVNLTSEGNSVFVNKNFENFEFEFADHKIKFQKYNYRKEKLERILNG